MKKSSLRSRITCWPLTHSLNLKGPEPTGMAFMGWVLGSRPSPKTCLGMTGNRSGTSDCMSAGCGLLSRITAVLRVGRIHPVHRIEHGGPEGVVLLDDREREGDVFRRDRLAVVEAGVPGEVEGVAPFVPEISQRSAR